MRRAALLAVVVLAACSGGSGHSASTTTTSARNQRWDVTWQEWQASTMPLTPEETAFEAQTKLAFGIGTNPPKMLEYGYDFCELYATSSKSRADVIRDWAVENNEPLQRASALGAAATDHLCP